ncbi:unnamed protein product [Linum trigynum]|uniref:Uncharacterized protein n=1 Tax=Linum trigynum TaxID=586398 RepID=A0AAV2CBP0_9ROSI
MEHPNSYIHSNIVGLVTLLEICKSAETQSTVVELRLRAQREISLFRIGRNRLAGEPLRRYKKSRRRNHPHLQPHQRIIHHQAEILHGLRTFGLAGYRREEYRFGRDKSFLFHRSPRHVSFRKPSTTAKAATEALGYSVLLYNNVGGRSDGGREERRRDETKKVKNEVMAGGLLGIFPKLKFFHSK